MNYYINAQSGKKRKTGKVIMCVLAYVAVFALSFFISFKLVASTQSGAEEIQALKDEISTLTSQLAQKEERISSLEMQIKNTEQLLAEAHQQAAQSAQPETAVTDAGE